jgi:hypothetical protein
MKARAIGSAVWLLALTMRIVAAPQTTDASMRSTLSGVYTSAQADKGKSGFLNLCVSCHNVASQSGDPWAIRWGGHPLYDLYGVIRETMPVEEPQSYSPILKAQIVAYLLRLNGMPAGTDELPTDVEVLKKIRIEIPRAGTGLAWREPGPSPYQRQEK